MNSKAFHQSASIVGKFVSNSICFERSICWLKNLLCWHYDHSLLIELPLSLFSNCFSFTFLFLFAFLYLCWLKNLLCWHCNHSLLIELPLLCFTIAFPISLFLFADWRTSCADVTITFCWFERVFSRFDELHWSSTIINIIETCFSF